jgi:hypothetical protein
MKRCLTRRPTRLSPGIYFATCQAPPTLGSHYHGEYTSKHIIQFERHFTD